MGDTRWPKEPICGAVVSAPIPGTQGEQWTSAIVCQRVDGPCPHDDRGGRPMFCAVGSKQDVFGVAVPARRVNVRASAAAAVNRLVEIVDEEGRMDVVAYLLDRLEEKAGSADPLFEVEQVLRDRQETGRWPERP